MPDYIQEVDHIVCIAPRDIRAVLIKFYGTGGTVQSKAIAMGLDRRSLRRRTDRADWYVHSQLDQAPAKAYSGGHNDTACRTRPCIAPHPSGKPWSLYARQE